MRTALPHVCKIVEKTLSGPYGRMFRASIRRGKLEVGDEMSLFARHLDEDLTFDIGNNAVLMNLDLKGTILQFVYYGRTYAYDHGLPGVWCQNYSTIARNLGCRVKVGDVTYDLRKLPGEYGTSLLENVLPVTEFSVDDRVSIKLIAFAPISTDGSVRPRAGVYGVLITNRTSGRIAGAVYPPEGSEHVTITSLDGVEVKPEMPYEIRAGGSYWLPLVIAAVPADRELDKLEKKTSAQWLRSTLDYFASLTGRLETPGDPYAGEFFVRCMHQCFNATVMDECGEIAGENSWGSYPVRDEIWMKDFHYTLTPLVAADPELGRRAIRWFSRWSVRYPGRFAGGIRHSISNSLAPVAMAGLYYAVTGDKAFFADDCELSGRLLGLLDGAIKLTVGGTGLLASEFISDGRSAGDYHTGSNIFAWYCLTSFARVAEEALGNKEAAQRYRRAAGRIKRDLLKHNIIDGPFGKQYIEGVNADGSLPATRPYGRGVEGPDAIPYMAHDGEESDTTLASFYGFTTYDDPALQNYKRFALTEDNVIYSPVQEGIMWGDHNACSTTFPGYVSGLAAACDAETFSGPEGYLTRIRKLTDLDGSIWWWPYADFKNSYRIAGHVTRGLGKCGWASGVFCCLFMSQFLGVNCDAPTRTLTFRPFLPSSDFTWERFRMGAGIFSASCRRAKESVTLEVTNHNAHHVTVRYRAVLPEGYSPKSVSLREDYSIGAFFGNRVVEVESSLKPGETKALRVSW